MPPPSSKFVPIFPFLHKSMQLACLHKHIRHFFFQYKLESKDYLQFISQIPKHLILLQPEITDKHGFRNTTNFFPQKKYVYESNMSIAPKNTFQAKINPYHFSPPKLFYFLCINIGTSFILDFNFSISTCISCLMASLARATATIRSWTACLFCRRCVSNS